MDTTYLALVFAYIKHVNIEQDRQKCDKNLLEAKKLGPDSVCWLHATFIVSKVHQAYLLGSMPCVAAKSLLFSVMECL